MALLRRHLPQLCCVLTDFSRIALRVQQPSSEGTPDLKVYGIVATAIKVGDERRRQLKAATERGVAGEDDMDKDNEDDDGEDEPQPK